MGSATLQLVMVTMRFFWPLLALAVMADNDKTEIAPAHTFNCPMVDIDLNGNDLDNFPTIDNWQECAHICNAVSASDPGRCRFWTFNPVEIYNSGCWLKSSSDGMRPSQGLISGERGCYG